MPFGGYLVPKSPCFHEICTSKFYIYSRIFVLTDLLYLQFIKTKIYHLREDLMSFPLMYNV